MLCLFQDAWACNRSGELKLATLPRARAIFSMVSCVSRTKENQTCLLIFFPLSVAVLVSV